MNQTRTADGGQKPGQSAQHLSHTPGPWYVNISPVRGVLCVVSDVSWICGELQARNSTAISAAECRANARLIAAAPDLLAALAGVLRVADRKTDEFDAARAAIAKAVSVTDSSDSTKEGALLLSKSPAEGG